MTLEQLTYQVHNNVVSGLKAMSVNSNHSILQIADEIISEYLTVMREFTLKGVLPTNEFMRKVGCVKVTCGSIEDCCDEDYNVTQIQTFKIPEIITDPAFNGISYVGSTDMSTQYKTYTSIQSGMSHKYRMRGSNKPYAVIDASTVTNGYINGYIYNAPLVKVITVVAIFKDPRKLTEFDCCSDEVEFPNTFVNTEVVKRVTEKMIRYYRQFAVALNPNDQTPKP